MNDALMRRRTLVVLALMYVLHSIDRQVVSVVLEPLKHEFHVNDRMLGFMSGLCYAGAFGLACLPVGWLIDRVNRRNLLGGLIAVWSGLTVLCGFAPTFSALVVARMGVGAAEAGGSPTAISLISDYVPAQERSSAVGVFYLCTALGIALSFLCGSALAAAFGWRTAFWMAGLPGLLVAILIFTVLKEPRRGAAEANGAASETTAPRFLEAMRYILTHKALLHLIAGFTLAALVTATIWIWATSLLVRVHGAPLALAGRMVALAALFNALGSWIGGVLGDRAARRNLAGLGHMAAVATVCMLPTGLVFAFAPSLIGSIIGLCLLSICLSAWLGPAYGLSMVLAPPHLRGVTSATIQLSVALFGSALGPVLAGAISDACHGDLRIALGWTVALSLWGALHFVLAARATRRSAIAAPEAGSLAMMPH